jgi:hypothetical protein
MLKIPSQISKVETTSDKCLKLIIHTTQELAPADEAEVFQLKPILLSEESEQWIKRNAGRLENGYFSITTTLLRRLPVPSKYKDKAASKS